MSLAESTDAAAARDPLIVERIARIGSGYPGGGVDRTATVTSSRTHSGGCMERWSEQSAMGLGEVVCTCGMQVAAIRALRRNWQAEARSRGVNFDPTDLAADPIEEAANVEMREHWHVERALASAEMAVSRMLGRHVSVDRTDDADGLTSIRIVQRCAACRADIEKLIASVATEQLALTAAVGIAARHAYVKHRCALLDNDTGLAGMSAVELESLAQDLERDGTAMIERSIAITKIPLPGEPHRSL